MFAQAQAAVGEATCLLRDRTQLPPADRFHRIDYVAEPRLFKMDDAQAVEKLIEIGHGVATQVPIAEMVKRDFLDGRPRRSYPYDPGMAMRPTE
jgi:hypothetical protein